MIICRVYSVYADKECQNQIELNLNPDFITYSV